MQKSKFVGISLVGMMLPLAGCGGGGGGGSTIVSPPPPPPPVVANKGFGANDCAAKPGSIACAAAGIVLQGPSIILSSDKRYSGNYYAEISGPEKSSNKIEFTSGSSTAWDDESFVWFYDQNGTPDKTAVANNIPMGMRFDPQYFGPLKGRRYSCNLSIQNCGFVDVNWIDAETSESGDFDYVFPFIRYEGLWPQDSRAYGVFGMQTGAFTPAMLTGTATFTGTTFGEYLKSTGGFYSTTSNLWLQANFASGAINGSATNFKAWYNGNGGFSSNYTLVNLTENLDFDFTASLTAADGTFSGNAESRNGGIGLDGIVIGSFFGEKGKSPDEVGLTYLLGDPLYGPYMAGAGVAGNNPNATPPSPPPPPPPPPPPLAPGCIAAECLTVAETFYGPSAMLNTKNASPGAANPVFSTYNDNISADVTIVVDPGATSNDSDDTYTITYKINGVDYVQSFTGLVGGSDVLGSFKAQVSKQNNYDNYLWLYDVSNSLSGTLDYVQVAEFDRQVSDTQLQIGFMVFGRHTLPADMPTSGSASFAGGTRGLYRVADGTKLYSTASDINMSANFGTGVINGYTSNFRFMDANGKLVNLSEKLDFNFNANIISGSSTFAGNAVSGPLSGGGLGISGNVNGAFYGEKGKEPKEVGITYKLGDPAKGAFMFGAGAMSKQK